MDGRLNRGVGGHVDVADAVAAVHAEAGMPFDADDVRAYRLPQRAWKITLGSSLLPEDILPDGEFLL